MGGENWETRWVRSRAGLLRSPRDLHLDLATFGARPSLRNFDPTLALLGTALATLGPFGRKALGLARHVHIFGRAF